MQTWLAVLLHLVSVLGQVAPKHQVSLNIHHGCRIQLDQTVVCFGRGHYGQLGGGTTIDSNFPQAMIGIASALEVCTLEMQTCVLLDAGGANKVRCTGSDFYGVLGNGDSITNSYSVATQVIAIDGVAGDLSGITKISCGPKTMLGISASGVVGWGRNSAKQLTYTTPNFFSHPKLVSGANSGTLDLDAGFHHVCVVSSTNTVMCVGSNQFGQLGDNSNTDSAVFVSAVTSAIRVTCGMFHTCALTNTGVPKCWGRGGEGQLGISTVGNIWKPTIPSNLAVASGYASIIAGYWFTCIEDISVNTGNLHIYLCSGVNNGGFADGTLQNRTEMDYYGASYGVASFLAAGDGFSCIIKNSDSSLRCSGSNTFGQLGINTNTPTLVLTTTGTLAPTQAPTIQPTFQPSNNPTLQPTKEPTAQPTLQPTAQPTFQPSLQPTAQPSTGQPTSPPSLQPLSAQPTIAPTPLPSTNSSAASEVLPVGAIAGGLVGGFFGLFVLAGLALMFIRRRLPPPPLAIFELAVPKNKSYHVFLSHAWGENERNHLLVKDLKMELNLLGIVCWFDEERLSGQIASQLSDALGSSCVFIACLNKDYFVKIEYGDNWCEYEWSTAFGRMKKKRMIAVAMEPAWANPANWPHGLVFDFLGNSLVIDSSSTYKAKQAAKDIFQVLEKIQVIESVSLNESNSEMTLRVGGQSDVNNADTTLRDTPW